MVTDVEVGHEQSRLVKHDENIYLYSFRPTLYLIHEITDALIPDFFNSAIPKVLAGIYHALFCAALAWLLIYLGFKFVPTVFLISLISVHYIINNTTLWNVFNAVALGYFFCVVGFIALLSSKRSVLGLCGAIVLWTLSIGAYQTNILLWAVIWLIIGISFWIRDKPIPLRFLFKSMLIFALCFITYLVYIKFYTLYTSDYDQRVLSDNSGLLAALEFRLRKILNMQINLSFSALAFYFGELNSMRLWYILPCIISLGVFISGMMFERKIIKWLLISTLLILLPLLAAAPLLGVSRPSITWRMSFPSLVAYSFTMFVVFSNFYENYKSRMLKLTVIALGVLLVIGLMPIAHLEAKSRLVAYQNDIKLLQFDKLFWEARAPVKPVKAFVFAKDIKNYSGNSDIYSGYNAFTKRSTFGFSALNHDFSWGGFLTMNGYDLESPLANSRTSILKQCLDSPDHSDEFSNWNILRDINNAVSYFCHE